jgi:hypothetical protein
MGYAVDANRVTWDEIDGETLIINVETGYYFSLDAVGSLVWRMLTEGLDEHAMVARIVSEYDVDESTARDDLQALIAALAGEELIESGGRGQNAEVR